MCSFFFFFFICSELECVLIKSFVREIEVSVCKNRKYA